MQISKLEIAGFKSFGARRIFEFNKGITAIVGPNGSGKSNVADAIRWVLGEQKNRRLRIAKAEDIIFYGTKSTPQASLAEVILHLDNTKGIIDLDTIEVELSRRLLRSGESEYRLNGRKAKLSKIEELLAQSGFGTQSYTVIGQGMIDQLLTATGPERKTLFDEASGIRQYDIRRNAARRDLNQASENLERVNGVLAELKPTIAILEKQAKSLEKAEKLKIDLDKARHIYLRNTYNDITKRIANIEVATNKSQLEHKQIVEKSKKLHNRVNLNINSNNDSEIQEQTLKNLEIERDNLTQKLLLTQSELNVLVTKQKEMQPANNQRHSLENKLKNINKKLSLLEVDQDRQNSIIKELELKVSKINKELGELSSNLNIVQNKLQKSQKKEFVNHALGLVQLMRVQLRQGTPRQAIDQTMHKLSHMLELALGDDAAAMATELIRLQNSIGNSMASREDIVELQTDKTISLRSIELDIATLHTDKETVLNEIEDTKKQTEIYEDNLKMITDHKLQISEQQMLLKKITTEITSKRKEFYSTSSDNLPSEINDIEKLASEKARLEFAIDQGKNDKKLLKSQQVELSKKAVEWFGQKYKFCNSPSFSRTPSLSDISQLEAELKAIEEIDPQMINEAKETASRIDFLQAQKKDLEKAIMDAQTLILSLEKDMKQRFKKAFEKLNKVFGEYFKKLFNGGNAYLELSTIEEDFGIEIIVQPPGKRGKNISALSGGEKALTSIALLASIILTNPSPFIVLDEVDAALDDENSTRFTKVLEELSKHSQLLVITHNHETMQSAHNLFGITSTSKGDSEVLPLALQQAEVYATN